MLKAIIAKIANNLGKGYKINPRTLQFGLHYVMGSQKPMTLNEEEIAITYEQILNSEANGRDEGVAHLLDAPGYVPGMRCWFEHPTAGVVGGFNYTIEYGAEETIYHCQDTWDFNNVSEKLYFTVNKNIACLVRGVAKTLNVKLEEKETSKGVKFSIAEGELSKLNDKHAFKTTWKVVEPNC